MGLFDLFTGDPAKEAAQINAALYRRYGEQAGGAISGGRGASLAALGAALPSSLEELRSGAARGFGTLEDYIGRGAGAIGGGLDTALTQLAGAREAYAPLSALGKKYGAGTDLYLDATGANGPEAAARARAAFSASPGYQWQVDQATEAANRAGVARGQAFGNTIGDPNKGVTALASNLANQEWGNWLNRLQAMVQPELAATTGAAQGVAGTYGAGAQAATTAGGQTGALYGQGGVTGSNIWNTLGQHLADVYSTDAARKAALEQQAAEQQANIYGNVTSGQTAANTQAAQAQMQGSANIWNALMNVGKMAVGAATGMPTGGLTSMGAGGGYSQPTTGTSGSTGWGMPQMFAQTPSGGSSSSSGSGGSWLSSLWPGNWGGGGSSSPWGSAPGGGTYSWWG